MVWKLIKNIWLLPMIKNNIIIKMYVVNKLTIWVPYLLISYLLFLKLLCTYKWNNPFIYHINYTLDFTYKNYDLKYNIKNKQLILSQIISYF